MLECLLGLFFIFIPFCLVSFYKDKFLGVASVFIGVFSFQLFLALILQYLAIFSYSTILLCNVIATGIVIVFCIQRGLSCKKIIAFFTRLRVSKINWFVVAAFIIVFYELFSVHYLYTGIAITNQRLISVTHAAYQYPYFSDEYTGIAFTEYSIRSHSLPLVNPLDKDVPFTNVFVCFFSIIAELFSLLGLDPLTGYVPLSIAIGFLSCVFAYIFLRSRNIDSFSASCAVLFLPLIINGGNLPGIWSLLPYNGGLLLFIMGLIVLPPKEIFISFRTHFVSFIAFFISIILYPPMIVFIAPVLFFVFYNSESGSSLDIRSYRFALFVLAGVALLGIIVSVFTHTSHFIIRNDLTEGIPSFPLWVVVPWFALIFSLVGFYVCLKERSYFVVGPIIVGIFYWITYAYTTEIFIIDYSKIVSITSFLVVLLAGFGINFFIKKIPQKSSMVWSTYLKSAVLSVFVLIAVSYPLETWIELVLHIHTPQGNVTVAPAPPVTSYLTNDDLRLFSGISNAVFIAPPWKGLVIGSITHNYPLDSKPATLTESYYSYQRFMALDCVDKNSIAKDFSLEYVYAEPFSCNDFMLIGSSTEGLYLYRFLGYN